MGKIRISMLLALIVLLFAFLGTTIPASQDIKPTDNFYSDSITWWWA